MNIKCSCCNLEFQISPSRYSKNKTGIYCCSIQCSSKMRTKTNCKCDVCGKSFYKKPNKIKNDKNHYCSMSCLGKHRKNIYLGKDNPNSFCRIKYENKRIHCGYYWIYKPDHPLCSKNGYIREHRLIAEKNHLNKQNSVEINGELYLKKEYDVHHINMNKLDNRPENLQVLTRREHAKLHQNFR